MGVSWVVLCNIVIRNVNLIKVRVGRDFVFLLILNGVIKL